MATAHKIESDLAEHAASCGIIITQSTPTIGAQLGGTGLQTVCDWELRFNTGEPDGLIDAMPPGGVLRLAGDAEKQSGCHTICHAVAADPIVAPCKICVSSISHAA